MGHMYVVFFGNTARHTWHIFTLGSVECKTDFPLLEVSYRKQSFVCSKNTIFILQLSGSRGVGDL